MSYLDALLDRVLAPERCIEPLVRPAEALADEFVAPASRQQALAGTETPLQPGASERARPDRGRRVGPMQERVNPISTWQATPTESPVPAAVDLRQPSASIDVDGPRSSVQPTPVTPARVIERTVRTEQIGVSDREGRPEPQGERVVERVIETRTALERAIEFVRGQPRERPVPAAEPRPPNQPASSPVVSPPPTRAEPTPRESASVITPPPRPTPARAPTPAPRERPRVDHKPVVRISIDRVIVRAEAPTAAPAAPRAADRAPRMGLDEYLSRRERKR